MEGGRTDTDVGLGYCSQAVYGGFADTKGEDALDLGVAWDPETVGIAKSGLDGSRPSNVTDLLEGQPLR